MEKDVAFYNGNTKIFGTLCLPGSSSKKLEGSGIASLRFDHSGCGQSEYPLGRIIAQQLKEDIMSAVSFLAAYPGIDCQRIGALGESMGGAVVLEAAAADAGICCVASFCPVADGYQWIKENWLTVRSQEAFEGFIKDLEADRKREAYYGRSNLVSMAYGLSYPQKYVGLIEEVGNSFSHREFTYCVGYEPIGSIFGFKPVDVVEKISPRPLLVMAGKKDGAVPYGKNAKLIYDRAGDIKRFELFEDGDHGLLTEPTKHKALDIITKWFEKYLIDVKVSPK